MTTYIHDGKEVKLTGRIATRQLRSNKVDTIHEIVPIDDAGSTAFRKWVKMTDLYKVASDATEK